MTSLHAALVTPLIGPLAPFGQACATGLALWARHAVSLPPPWTGVELDVRDIGSDAGAAMRAAVGHHVGIDHLSAVRIVRGYWHDLRSHC